MCAEGWWALVNWEYAETEYARVVESHARATVERDRVSIDVARANRLAHVLREMGVGPNMPVGLHVRRSLDLLVGALGIIETSSGQLDVIREEIEKMRSMGPAENAMLKAFGANPTTMAFGDVPPALETGVIDGAEQSMELAIAPTETQSVKGRAQGRKRAFGSNQ